MRINTHTHPALPRRVPPRPALFFCAHSGGWGVERRAARQRQMDAGTSFNSSGTLPFCEALRNVRGEEGKIKTAEMHRAVRRL